MVSEDFKRVLARVQADYGFYIECQTNPAVALAGYDLSPDERLTLTDPERLGGQLIHGLMITISGTHDWVNRAAADKKATDKADRDATLEAIKRAGAADERTRAVLRLMEQVG